MREKKNWVEKSDKNSHHNSTSIKENIVKMLKRLFAQKNVRFLVSFFFLPFKRGQKKYGFELSSSFIFSGVQGSLG